MFVLASLDEQFLGGGAGGGEESLWLSGQGLHLVDEEGCGGGRECQVSSYFKGGTKFNIHSELQMHIAVSIKNNMGAVFKVYISIRGEG